MDMELSQEQVTRIASSIFIGDVLSYINSHNEDYKQWLQDEKIKGNITNEELNFELKQIEIIKEEVKNA